MGWSRSWYSTSTKAWVFLGLAFSASLFSSPTFAALRILPSIPIPAPQGQHTEVHYRTTMLNKAGHSVEVGASSLTSQLNGSNPVGSSQTAAPLAAAPQSPANLQTMSQHLIPSAATTSSRSGLAAFKTNAPLTAQQQAVANALTARFAPDQQLTPQQVLKPTFMHLKTPTSRHSQ